MITENIFSLILIFFIFLVTAYFVSKVGLGGGIIFVPTLIYIADLSLKEAVPISLCCICGLSFVSLINHAKRNEVNFKVALILVKPGE